MSAGYSSCARGDVLRFDQSERHTACMPIWSPLRDALNFIRPVLVDVRTDASASDSEHATHADG